MIAMAVGSFTAMTFLTKNSFLDEIRKQYVVAARAKGLGEGKVLYGHVFRNAMLLIISGFPAAFIGAFTTMTFLTKNSFLDEIRKQYVITARAKGLNEGQVLYGHVFRNAMLLVIAGFPGAFISAFFSGSLLIETIFSLDGLGLLGFESIINRDYPVVFATLYNFSLLGLVVNLISDFVYTLIDPRIDFESREV
jgi:ABC-type microcin C transport system permease subunit YejB